MPSLKAQIISKQDAASRMSGHNPEKAARLRKGVAHMKRHLAVITGIKKLQLQVKTMRQELSDLAPKSTKATQLRIRMQTKTDLIKAAKRHLKTM
jgi:hypothetical protein